MHFIPTILKSSIRLSFNQLITWEVRKNFCQKLFFSSSQTSQAKSWCVCPRQAFLASFNMFTVLHSGRILVVNIRIVCNNVSRPRGTKSLTLTHLSGMPLKKIITFDTATQLWVRIHNTLFSLKPANGPNQLECVYPTSLSSLV